MSDSTGLDARSVALAIGDLRALRLVDDRLRPSYPPPARLPSSLESLPPGIEPWSGDELPLGQTSSDIPPSSNPDVGLSEWPRHSSAPPASRSTPVEALNYRKLYEQQFRDFSIDERIAHANDAQGPELLALCLDSSPRVVSALLANSGFALDHARTVAAHHSTPAGLEQLARHAVFLRDTHVARRLLRNSQLPDGLLLRLLSGRRLLQVYRSCVDRDLPERNRMRVRAQLRPCFMRAEPDERTALILKTEGRCLGQLVGCTFDGKTTQLLCNHNYASTLLIQNLARFAATPPVLLNKLSRSGPVRRQEQLRALLRRHPNYSSQ